VAWLRQTLLIYGLPLGLLLGLAALQDPLLAAGFERDTILWLFLIGIADGVANSWYWFFHFRRRGQQHVKVQHDSAGYQELLEHLTQNWEMKPQYARPFLDAYKKDVVKKLARGRRRTEKAITGNDPTASLAAHAMEGQELDYSLVAQAYEAYMTDLRRGRHVGTPVEKATWAILFNRSDLLESIDQLIHKTIVENSEQRFPGLLVDVLGGDAQEPRASPQPAAEFELSGSMPDVTLRPPLAMFLAGNYALALADNAPSIAERMTGERMPIEYLYVLAVLDRTTKKPCMFVTLERGLPGSLFLCAFNPDGSHVNLGDGEAFSEQETFVRAATAYARKTLRIAVGDVQRVG
jgi:hypothetical protein